MSDFDPIRGFEELWRPVARSRRVRPDSRLEALTLDRLHGRLRRLAARAPEVMVKITGRTRDEGHLQAHLAYICRDGVLPLEGRDGERLVEPCDVRELGRDWALDDVRHRRDAALSLSVVLSMPAGTSSIAVRDAARAFAAEVFGETFDYVFALHTDADHPHVHLAVRMLGKSGQRLNPRKGDLDHWRQTFARLLRDRDIAAEATPRRARGVVRKAEPISVRKLRERYEQGRGPAPHRLASAWDEARRAGLSSGGPEVPWASAVLRRQRHVRGAYLTYAARLERAGEGDLAAELRAFVEAMPEPRTRHSAWVERWRRAGLGEATKLRDPTRSPDGGDRDRS